MRPTLKCCLPTKLPKAILVTLATALACTASQAATLVIDDFDSGLVFLASPSGQAVTVSVNASVLGGVRRVDIDPESGKGPAFAIVDPAGAIVPSGIFSVANNLPASVSGLTYDAAGAGLGVAGNFNSYSKFEVLMNAAQLAGGSLLVSIKVRDADGDMDVVSQSLTSDILNGSGGSALTFSLGSFASTIDFGRIDSVAVTFDTGTDMDVDFQVARFSLIPEPSTFTFLLASLGGVVFRRNRPRN